MTAPGAFVAPDQHIVGGIEEQGAHPLAVAAQRVEHVGQVVEVLGPGAAPAPADD